MYELIGDEIYFIKSNIHNVDLVYAPLKRKLFYVRDLEYDLVKQSYYKNCFHIDDKLCNNLERIRNTKNQLVSNSNVGMRGNRAVFLITNKCNLACKYCYAKEEHNIDSLHMELFEQVVDFIFKCSNEAKHFTFIGGGEPFADWELLKNCILYIRRTQGKHIAYIGVQTNATLLSKEKIDFLKRYNVKIGCSFDILPNLQNSHRPFENGKKKSFDIVDEAIHMCIDNGVIPHIRSTISKSECGKMPDMVEFAINHYPEIKVIHLEHVSDKGLTWDNYYREFMYNYFEARQIAAKKGIYLKNSITRAVNSLKTRFCSGEMCITTQGDIVACHRVSGEKDNLFQRFNYGKVDKGVQIYNEKLDEINKMFGTKRLMKCDNCFCKYHCAGQCCNNKNAYNDNDYEELCRFTQEMVRRELEYVLGLK